MKLTLSEQQLQNQVRYFAYYQVLAGFFTAGSIALVVAQLSQITGLLLLFYTSGLALAGFGMYCGYLTFRHPRRGLQLSRLNLLLQFAGFAAAGYGFRFFAGLFISFTVDLSPSVNVSFSAGLGDFSFSINSSPEALYFSFNLVAMLLFFRTTQWLNEWDYRYQEKKTMVKTTEQ